MQKPVFSDSLVLSLPLSVCACYSFCCCVFQEDFLLTRILKFVAEIRHKKMSFPISQNQHQQHLTSASLKRKRRRKRTSTRSVLLLHALLFIFLVEILPVVRAFSFLKSSSFNTRADVNLNSISSMSDLVKEEKRDAITVAEDSSSVKAEEKEEKRDDASTIAEDSSSSFSAEIDATTSLIAKKAKELEQTLKLFERQRMDLHPPSKEETPSYVKFERRPRRVLGDFNTSDWKAGRATWYGGPSGPGPDGMSIYTGSCGYGQDLGNHFITAVQTDGGYDYGLTEECGKCIEVVCVNGPTRGFEWSELGKWAGCQEPAVKSVVVKITDSCPCNHPNEGNKRWCCGDREHLDLSYAAFDQIAIRHRGVVDLKFRPASCKDQGKVVSYY